MVDWMLKAAGVLALLSLLPRPEREAGLLRIGQACLGWGLFFLLLWPVGGVLDRVLPRGLPLTVAQQINVVFNAAFPLVVAGLAIHLGRMARWAWLDLVRGAHREEASTNCSPP